MKRLSLLIAFSAGALMPVLIGWTGQKQETGPAAGNGRVLAIRKMKLKPGISAATFEQFAARVAADEFGKLPGVSFYFGKSERGDELGSYILIMDFDSRTTRNYYAPDEGVQRSAEATKMVDDYFAKHNPELDKLAEVEKPAGKQGYIDYVLLQ